MTAPDAVPPQAIKAAIEGLHEWDILTAKGRENIAHAALAAAYPAIREHFAGLIEADDGIAVHPWLVGMNRAARIVRGGDR